MNISSIPNINPVVPTVPIDSSTSLAQKLAALHQLYSIEERNRQDEDVKKRKLKAIKRQIDRLNRQLMPLSSEPYHGPSPHLLDTTA